MHTQPKTQRDHYYRQHPETQDIWHALTFFLGSFVGVGSAAWGASVLLGGHGTLKSMAAPAFAFAFALALLLASALLPGTDAARRR